MLIDVKYFQQMSVQVEINTQVIKNTPTYKTVQCTNQNNISSTGTYAHFGTTKLKPI